MTSFLAKGLKRQTTFMLADDISAISVKFEIFCRSKMIFKTTETRSPLLTITAGVKNKCIEDHKFNESFNLVATDPISSKFVELYYYWVEFHPLFLLKESFVNECNLGTVTGLSVDADLTSSHVFALSDSILTLNVDKDTYELLGLTGSKSKVDNNRRNIRIDFNDNFKPGQKGYERVKWCLNQFFEGETIRMYLASNDKITGFSRELMFDSSVNFKKVVPAWNIREMNNVKIPLIETMRFDSFSTGPESTCKEMIFDVFEWAGLALNNSFL